MWARRQPMGGSTEPMCGSADRSADPSADAAHAADTAVVPPPPWAAPPTLWAVASFAGGQAPAAPPKVRPGQLSAQTIRRAWLKSHDRPPPLAMALEEGLAHQGPCRAVPRKVALPPSGMPLGLPPLSTSLRSAGRRIGHKSAVARQRPPNVHSITSHHARRRRYNNVISPADVPPERARAHLRAPRACAARPAKRRMRARIRNSPARAARPCATTRAARAYMHARAARPVAAGVRAARPPARARSSPGHAPRARAPPTRQPPRAHASLVPDAARERRRARRRPVACALVSEEPRLGGAPAAHGGARGLGAAVAQRRRQAAQPQILPCLLRPWQRPRRAGGDAAVGRRGGRRGRQAGGGERRESRDEGAGAGGVGGRRGPRVFSWLRMLRM